MRADPGLWDPVCAALRDLCDRYDKPVWGPLHAADRYYDLGTETPLAGLVALLAEFGAVTGDPGKPMITPLGRWAAGRLPEGLPGLADPGLPVAEMIAEAARFSGRACPGRTWTRASRRSGPPATRMPRDLRGPWRSSPHPLR